MYERMLVGDYSLTCIGAQAQRISGRRVVLIFFGSKPVPAGGDEAERAKTGR